MRQPRYKSVVDGLANAIREGRLDPGTRLPAHRELARRHGMALATATRVYAELREAGLVVGEPGRGTFVRERSVYAGADAERLPRRERIADLSFTQPVSPGQADALREALRRLSSAGDVEALLMQHPPGGRRPDRAAVATHLLDRGIDVPPDRVLLTAGAQHGLDVAVRTVASPGEVVAVDELTYPGIKLIADRHGVELAPVPHGPRGTDLDALDALCAARRVAAVYTMPTLHNPLGTVMPAAERVRLAAIARRAGAVLIEDATHAFLVAEAPAPLQTLAPERTLYVESLSKNVATGLRVGFLVAPPRHRRALTTTLRSSAWGPSSIVTALATGWLRDGTVAALEARRRDDAATRQRLAARVFACMPYDAHPSALFGWLPLPPGVSDARVARELAEAGVLVSTADAFAVGPSARPALRLSLGTPSTPGELERALDTVRAVVVASPPR